MKKNLVIFSLLLIVIYVGAQTSPRPKPKSGLTNTNSRTIKVSIDSGKKIYTVKCLVCHQVDGSGVPNMNPPLSKTKWVLGDKKKLINVVLKGMNGPIVINDDEFHNPMPPHLDMNDKQIADVLTYIRNSFGNKASAVTAAEVKVVRTKG